MKDLTKSAIVLVLLLGCLFGASFLIGQAQDTPAAPAASPQKNLTIDDVLKLSKAGISEDVIISKIRKNGQAFDLSPDQMLQLKTAGVNDRVIQVMLDPAAAQPAPVAAAAPDNTYPDDSGVYFKKASDKTWNEVLPEVVNWKTGGVLKGIATSGIVKKDTNGHLQGKTSKTQVATTTEFLIVVPDGVAISEYQLLHLHQNSDNREFRSTTGGVFHSSGGATRDALEFQNKKVAPHRYLITLPQMKAGEFAFLPPGAVSAQNAAGSTGKVYAFTVLE